MSRQQAHRVPRIFVHLFSVEVKALVNNHRQVLIPFHSPKNLDHHLLFHIFDLTNKATSNQKQTKVMISLEHSEISEWLDWQWEVSQENHAWGFLPVSFFS